MTQITLEYFQIVANNEESPLTVKSGEDVTDRRGKYMRVDPTTGKAMLGNASSTNEIGSLRGVALSTQKNVGDSVTLFRWGLLDWGDALDSMAFGATIYVSDTDGIFADAQGSNSAPAGKVWPVFEHDGTVKRLAYIDLR